VILTYMWVKINTGLLKNPDEAKAITVG